MLGARNNSAEDRVRRANRVLALGIAALAILLMSAPARAQTNSFVGSVNLNASLATSLTVNASPGLVNFALVPSGTVTGSALINVTTAWTLKPSVGAVTTYAYFTTAAAALTDGSGDNIPVANVSGSVNGGAFSPFTGASPFGGATAVTLSSTRILGNNKTGSHTDTLNLSITTTGLGLPAATYTGVLNIEAQAL
jgi:hypothetical protein